MNRIKTTAAIRIYELDGQDNDHDLTVESHWNKSDFVVLKFGAVCVTVNADDLIEAVKRCSK